MISKKHFCLEDLLQIDEPELMDMSSSGSYSPIYSSPTNVSSDSIGINDASPFSTSTQFTTSTLTSTSPILLNFYQGFHWLLPPYYDSRTIIWLDQEDRNSTTTQIIDTSQSIHTKEENEEEEDLDSLASILFEDIVDCMNNNAEFQYFFQEYSKANWIHAHSSSS